MVYPYPKARKDQMVVREIEGEVLIYDLARNKALCLNPLAAAVWKRSDGATSPDQMAVDVSYALGVSVEPAAVWAAIDRLGRDHLLEYCISKPAPRTRRQQLKSLGKAAAIAGPLVVTLSTPAAAQGRSCINSGQTCSPGGARCCNPNATCVSNGKKGGGPFVCRVP